MDNQDSYNLIKDLRFCVIDLETTGGNHQKDKIIEIGMVKVEGLEITDTMSFLVDPKMPIPEFIQKLTRISQSDVEGKPEIESIIDEILKFIGDDIIIAHNTSFDVPFLNGVLSRMGREKLENKVLCTNVMTKHLIPEILNSNLNYMSSLFEIDHSMAHRALDDAKATAKLLVKYLNIFIGKGIKKVNQLYYPKNKFELDRTHFSEDADQSEIIKLIKNQNSNLIVTVKGERGLILASIPLESPKEEYQFVEDVLNKLDWKLITIRLINPMLEGIFQFNNHYLKYPEEIRVMIKNHLLKKYTLTGQESDIVNIDQLDFVISNHLIKDQVAAYSFLHLNTNTKSIFKIPAQKKKLYQHLLTQVSKFETSQKGRKKHLIHPDLIELVQNYLTLTRGQNKYLYLDRKETKLSKEATIKSVEEFVFETKLETNFPTKHL